MQYYLNMLVAYNKVLPVSVYIGPVRLVVMEQGGASVGNQVVLLSVAVPARLVSRSL